MFDDEEINELCKSCQSRRLSERTLYANLTMYMCACVVFGRCGRRLSFATKLIAATFIGQPLPSNYGRVWCISDVIITDTMRTINQKWIMLINIWTGVASCIKFICICHSVRLSWGCCSHLHPDRTQNRSDYGCERQTYLPNLIHFTVYHIWDRTDSGKWLVSKFVRSTLSCATICGCSVRTHTTLYTCRHSTVNSFVSGERCWFIYFWSNALEPVIWEKKGDYLFINSTCIGTRTQRTQLS